MKVFTVCRIIIHISYHSLPQQLSDARVAYRPKSRGEAIVGVGGVLVARYTEEYARQATKKGANKGMTYLW